MTTLTALQAASNSLNNQGDGIVQGDFVVIVKTGEIGRVVRWHHDQWYSVRPNGGFGKAQLLNQDRGEIVKNTI